MKKMSLKEFADSWRHDNITSYVYDTNNQSWNNIFETSAVSMVFDRMVLSFAPNIVCLLNNCGTILLKRVKYIIRDHNKSSGNTIIKVVCGNKCNDSGDVIHTILVRK